MRPLNKHIFVSIMTLALCLHLLSCQSSRDIAILRKEVSQLKKTIEETQGRKFSVLFIGDIIIANHSRRLMKKQGGCYPFQKIKGDLDRFDFVIGNLETPISRRGIPVKNRVYVFQLDPVLARCLTTIKLNAVSLANNHLFDFGKEGMDDTLSFLKKSNISYAGAGKNLSEARRPAVLKHGNTKLYLLSYSGRPPDTYYAAEDMPGTAPLNLRHVIEDVEYNKRRDNVVIVSLHWGIEQTSMPNNEQIQTAHEIIDAGADGVIGHHPHWPQGIEIYRGKPIIYSLGNFVNGHYNVIEKDNIMAVFHFNENILEEIEVLSIAGRNRETKFQPFVIKGQEARKNLTIIKNFSKILKTEIEIVGYKGIIRLGK